RPFEEIYPTPAWAEYWGHGARAQVPGGERIVDVQTRALAVAEQARRDFSPGPVLLISHADVIKTMLTHYLGLSLDHWQGFKCDPASISIIHVEPDRVRVARLNGTRY
ncbi:MAG: histidine phosphatase family protein, partial [Deltaproteobacteria bacterium]|nr:histidine phosphatase family protein [Deltaproteobacteria bacterium]